MKTGDWVDTLHGIGKVISIHPIYADDFDTLFNNKTLGEKLQDIIVYKVFCDFDGNIKKRVFFDSGDSSCCTPLCEDSQKLIDNILIGQPQKIDDFTNKTSQKKFGSWIYIYLNYEEDNFKALDNVKGLKYPISYSKYAELISGLNVELKLKHYSVDPNPYITLSFYNENFEYSNGQRLFTRVNCTHIKRHA